MASKKHWKKRAKRAERSRGEDQARHFERVSSLEAQLRAVDHILEREIAGPSLEEWRQQVSVMLQELVTCRRECREDGYTARDMEKLRAAWSFPYVEHFVPEQPIPTIPVMSEQYRHAT